VNYTFSTPGGTSSEPIPAGEWSWSYEKNLDIFPNMKTTLFGDRIGNNNNRGENIVLATQVPEIVKGQHWIRMSLSAKNTPIDTHIMIFTALVDMTVYVGVDSRWLPSIDRGWGRGPYFITYEEWEDTGEMILDNQNTPSRYHLYKKDFKAGDVIKIGPTDGSNDHCPYIVVIVPK
jgi:hypothetical protein